MTYRTAALCAGYGGLEQGLTLAGIDHELAWYSELEDSPAADLLNIHTGAPNLGDLTQIVDPPEVDIMTAGFPCQPVSMAGQRKGTEDERWLIRDICNLARRARAQYLILENVPGLLSANSGDAMANVISALAEARFSARWTSLRASDIGACHRRERWFAIATDTSSVGRSSWSRPRSSEQAQLGGHGPSLNNRTADLTLLPTPTATQAGGTAEQHLERKRNGKMNRANPTITDLGLLVESDVEWGKYAEAIARHEFMLDRDAPDPTIDCRLSPLFVEWMMGLPPGHVTRFIENRRHALHVLGNGVVPQQAAAAISSVIPAALEVAA